MEVYVQLLRDRIAMLCVERNVSEHKLSLELGKSGSYIRSITSGKSLPSYREFLNITDYFGMSPAEFFSSFTPQENGRVSKAAEQLWTLENSKAEGVCQLIEWLK